jgi:hypothetical protein
MEPISGNRTSIARPRPVTPRPASNPPAANTASTQSVDTYQGPAAVGNLTVVKNDYWKVKDWYYEGSREHGPPHFTAEGKKGEKVRVWIEKIWDAAKKQYEYKFHPEGGGERRNDLDELIDKNKQKMHDGAERARRWLLDKADKLKNPKFNWGEGGRESWNKDGAGGAPPDDKKDDPKKFVPVPEPEKVPWWAIPLGILFGILTRGAGRGLTPRPVLPGGGGILVPGQDQRAETPSEEPPIGPTA